MYVLGVTGGIGSGKTTASRLFEALGATVIDLDHLAKHLIAEDGPLHDEVLTTFGYEILGGGMDIDPAALAAIAFSSPENARRLDNIVHPGVYNACAGAIDLLARMPDAPRVVVLDIPLLVEAPEFFDLLDGVLAISANEDVRVERLMARGMSEEDVRSRMSLQASDAERREIADWSIENDGTPVRFESELVALWDEELAPREA